MKKIWIILLAMVAVIAVCACFGADDVSETNTGESIITMENSENNNINSSTNSKEETTSKSSSVVQSSNSSVINSSKNDSATTSSKISESQQITSSSNKNERIVYRTPSGKRYHLDPDCGGKNSYSISISKAESAGLTPCQKCAS